MKEFYWMRLRLLKILEKDKSQNWLSTVFGDGKTFFFFFLILAYYPFHFYVMQGCFFFLFFFSRWGMNCNKGQLDYVESLEDFNKIIMDPRKKVSFFQPSTM